MEVRIIQQKPQTYVLLNVENLNTRFFIDGRVVKAVDGVSYTLNEGECLGIVGESGCGKSAHARSIMGLINPLTGTYQADKIWFNGLDLLKLSSKEMRKVRGSKITMVFQDPMNSLNPVLKIGDQLSEVLKLHMGMDNKQAWKRSEELLGLVRIADATERLQSYPYQLSGGMRQRVMIAMAISCNPKLLIADEPTTALDVTIQARIIDLVTEIQKEFGMAIMWITHNLGAIASLAETVNVMYAGSIIERGNVLDIYAQPLHPYTKGLLSSLPHLGYTSKKLLSIPGLPPNLIDLSPGCAFAPRCSYAKDLCHQQKPDLDVADSKDHLVACFFWKEIEVQRKSKLFSLENNLVDGTGKAEGNSVLLSVKDLKTYFPITKGVIRHHVGDIKAVDGVSFEINQGEVLGLVGESGSGKTTVGLSILRLIEPTDGRVIFKGKDITSMNNKELRQIRPKMQMIFQNTYSSLNPQLNIESILSRPLEVDRFVRGAKKRERIKELMEMVGLDQAYINRYPNEFSGGEQQRTGIARALAMNPDLIICDEPVSSLDVSIQAQIVNLLKSLQDQLGIAYLFISHDLSMVYYICDRVAVMYLGKIMELAGKDELYSNPQHPYTKFLLSATPVPDPAIEKKHTLPQTKEDDIPSATNPPQGCKFNTRCSFAEKVCFDLEPEYKEITHGHYCRCHLVH